LEIISELQPRGLIPIVFTIDSPTVCINEIPGQHHRASEDTVAGDLVGSNAVIVNRKCGCRPFSIIESIGIPASHDIK